MNLTNERRATMRGWALVLLVVGGCSGPMAPSMAIRSEDRRDYDTANGHDGWASKEAFLRWRAPPADSSFGDAPTRGGARAEHRDHRPRKGDVVQFRRRQASRRGGARRRLSRRVPAVPPVEWRSAGGAVGGPGNPAVLKHHTIGH